MSRSRPFFEADGIVLELLPGMNLIDVVARLRLEDYRASLERLVGEHGGREHPQAARDLAEVRAAIERINQGAYGMCERCGGAIGSQRLLALPTAHFCIACASVTRSADL